MTDFNFDGEDLDDLPDYGEGPTFGSADLPEGCVPQSDADDPSDYLTTPRGLPGAPEEPVLREPEDGEKYSRVSRADVLMLATYFKRTAPAYVLQEDELAYVLQEDGTRLRASRGHR